MPGSFHGINLAGNALRAFQYGMDISGHNMANVNTRGYTRQTVEYQATDPASLWAGRLFQLGQGVAISSVNRVRDGFLDARMQAAQGDLGRYSTMASSIQQLEGVFGEPGPNGIGASMDRFFSAFSALGSDPNSTANRIEVQQAGQTLSNRIRGAFHELTRQSAQTSSQINETIREIDSWSSKIAQLNMGIREQMATGGVPNDLLDQRDVAIEELSKLVNIVTTPGDTGEVYVHFSGLPLVDVGGSRAFPSTTDAANFRVSDGTYQHDVRSGKLYGLFELQNKVAAYKGDLDTLANALRKEVNAIHKTGTNPNGSTNVPFFTENATDPQNGAIDFDLTALIKADPNNIATSLTGVAGDGGLALSISNLKNQASAELGGKSYSKWYSEFISGVGRDASFAADTLTTHEALLGQVESQRQSVVGVSIDDEMANLLKLQKSYQAAAKVLTIFDQMTEEIINMVR